VTDIELRSLAPKYNKEYHQTYVIRLNAAVSDLRNRNIALTGSYGAGKSSILDAFITGQVNPADSPESKRQRFWQTIRRTRRHPAKVLRISINTLGPDKGEDLTNRIQKELVKQLVYRAKPGEVRSSEFARTPRLKWWRAGLDALGATVAIVGLLWLFGLRPAKDSLGTDGFWLPMVAMFVLVLGILWATRWYIGNRVVAQVSAGGASIALEGRSDSFFDKYLDELIAFFEATEPDIVIFEDLDRFDDPRIFDSLRELNTLVNSSAHWIDRPKRPLRFIYAIKDSLFEKLGDEQQEKDRDENQ
jgi:Cdc6-like AAA superfamily ATPase